MNLTARFCLALLLLCSLLPLSLRAQQKSPYLQRIGTAAAFKSLSGKPLVTKYAGTTAVKVLYDLARNRLYYFSQDAAGLHFTFAVKYLGEPDDLFNFNEANYSASPERRYMLGNVDYFPHLDQYALEFSVGDDIPASLISRLYEAVKASFIPGARLSVLVNTPLLVEKTAKLPKPLPLLTPDAVYGSQRLQSVSEGRGCGTLRIIRSGQHANAAPDDILVIHGFTADLPLCAGAILTELQTPLSHVSVLAHNRGTPVIAYRHAATFRPLLNMEGSRVCLRVNEDSFYLEPYRADRLPEKKARIRLTAIDTLTTALAPLSQLSEKKKATYGAKASYLGELGRVSTGGNTFGLPRGAFAIPFSAFQKHMRRSGADRLVAAVAADSALQADDVRLKAALKDIRKLIRSTPVDTGLLQSVEAMLRKGGIAGGARFRSSANAEDIKGFNGAGLYDSKTGSLTDSSRPVSRALTAVWASLYKDNAWRERAAAGIPQQSASMAVLVHQSFPDELANGVAITRNIYRDRNGGFVINVQAGEVPVVSPPEGVRAEQFITYYNVPGDFYATKKPVDYITYSSLANEKPLLSAEEIRQLTTVLGVIKAHFYYRTSWRPAGDYSDAALDIEFKFIPVNGKRKLLIKQVRPYR